MTDGEILGMLKDALNSKPINKQTSDELKKTLEKLDELNSLGLEGFSDTEIEMAVMAMVLPNKAIIDLATNSPAFASILMMGATAGIAREKSLRQLKKTKEKESSATS